MEVKFKVAIDFPIIGSNFPLRSPKFIKNFSIHLSSNDWKKINKKSSLNPVKRIYLLNSGSALQNLFVNKALLIFSKKMLSALKKDDFDIQDSKQLEIMKEKLS